jgi:hypothetical protein
MQQLLALSLDLRSLVLHGSLAQPIVIHSDALPPMLETLSCDGISADSTTFPTLLTSLQICTDEKSQYLFLPPDRLSQTQCLSQSQLCALPPTLTSLKFVYLDSSGLDLGHRLPSSLTSLSVLGLNSVLIRGLNQLPGSLLHFNYEGWAPLPDYVLQSLPVGLQSLNCSHGDWVIRRDVIPQLPRTLLHIYSPILCEEIDPIRDDGIAPSPLPPGLKTLILQSKILARWYPSTLNSLQIPANCLVDLSHTNITMMSIRLTWAQDSLENLMDMLPRTLQHLELSQLTKYSRTLRKPDIEHIPASVTSLVLHSIIPSPDAPLPAQLKSLRVSVLLVRESFNYSQLPSSLTDLEIDLMTPATATDIAALPMTLKTLKLNNLSPALQKSIFDKFPDIILHSSEYGSDTLIRNRPASSTCNVS